MSIEINKKQSFTFYKFCVILFKKGGVLMLKDLNRVYKKEDIFAQLEAMGAPRDGMVIMHSSLRLVGKVEGGAEALLDILIEYFTEKGGLFCVPAHTWRNLRKEIVLDMTDSETSLGAFSNIAAADGRGVRSENPTHSTVVFGDRKRAEELVRDELWVKSGTSPQSLYGKLYERGGYVLLVGVAQDRNTYLHAVDEILGVPNRITSEPREVAVKRATGEIVKTKLCTHYTTFTKDISRRFPRFETAFRYHGAIKDGFLGNAPAQLCDARIMKETMELIFKNYGGDPLEGEYEIIAPKYFV